MELVIKIGQEIEIGPSDDLLTLKLVEVECRERATIAISSARNWGLRGCPNCNGPQGAVIKLSFLGDFFYAQVDISEIIDDKSVKLTFERPVGWVLRPKTPVASESE